MYNSILVKTVKCTDDEFDTVIDIAASTGGNPSQEASTDGIIVDFMDEISFVDAICAYRNAGFDIKILD